MKSMFVLQILLAISFLFVISCNNKDDENKYEAVYCDAENISKDSTMIVPASKFWTSSFKGAKLVTDEQAKTGKHSVKLFGKEQFGMQYVINNVLPGDKFHVEVWRLGESAALVVSARNTDMFYTSQKEVSDKDEFGWEKLELEVEIPANFTEDELLVYVWNPKKENAVFVDDLKIAFIGNNEVKK